MALNGIDISNWQSGINLAVVPCDFVVIKATEGTGYVNPDYERAYRQAKTAGKCLGIYHYASGGNIQAEAEYFLKNAGSRVGEAMLVLDWEGRSNPAFGVNDREWVKAWCNYISTKTSVNPVVYVQQSMMSRLQNIGNYGLWVAQYASMEPIGYQENPWNEGAYACVMRQYSSSGRLSGWNGNLDLNKFYGDRQAWSRYAGKGNQTTPEKPSEEEENQEGTTLDLVFRTMRGEFGNGEERKSWLGTRYGDDDDKIRLNQRKPSKYKGLRRFGPEKNLQRINKFMKERPIFYKNFIQMKENFRFYLRCFYCITKVVILQFNSENRTELARNG